MAADRLPRELYGAADPRWLDSLGGIVGTPLVAALSVRHGWPQILVTGSVCALVAALLWLRVDASKRTLPVADADTCSAINGVQQII